MPRRTRTLPLLLAAAVAGAATPGTGIVESPAGRMTGSLHCTAGTVTVGETAVPLDEIIFAVHDPGVRTIGGSHVVRLTNGEIWSAEVLSLAAGKLTVRFDLFGEATVGVDRISFIDFTAARSLDPDLAEGTLYRQTGEPIPGEVLWIDARQIAMDSPLGVVKLKRDGARSYVFTKTETLPPVAVSAGEEDEIRLVDGSVLRGRLSLGPQGIALEHRAIGTMTIPESAWRSFSRRRAAYCFMTELRPASVTAYGLVLEKPPGSPLTYRRGDELKVGPPGFFKAMVIRPKSVIRYHLPLAGARSATLRGSVGAARGCRGDVRVRITTTEGTVFEKELAAGAAPVPMAVELGGARELTVHVDFGARIGFPCEAIFVDPMVIAEPAGEKPPATTGPPAEAEGKGTDTGERS